MTQELTLNNLKFRSFEWSPKEDITTHELALCMNVLLCKDYDYAGFYDKLPDNAKRHFVEL